MKKSLILLHAFSLLATQAVFTCDASWDPADFAVIEVPNIVYRSDWFYWLGDQVLTYAGFNTFHCIGGCAVEAGETLFQIFNANYELMLPLGGPC